MFLKWKSTEGRQAYGGSDFVEIQYCRLPFGTSDKKLVSVNGIDHWEGSSVYVSGDNIDVFWNEYNGILDNGLYNNTKEGVVDLYGINYYNEEKTKTIIEKLKSSQPIGFEILLEWLQENPYHNGFYVLGI